MNAPVSDADVPGRLGAVRERLGAAARRAGRTASDVRLVAVTKGVAPPAIRAVLQAGVTDLGESRAQELVAKANELAAEAPAWHFVGRIQRNKVKALAPVVTLWQSVERAEVGAAIAERAPGARVLVEVNTAGDPAKGGCRPEEAGALVDALRTAGLAVEGLMTVPAYGPDPRPAFAALRDLAGGLGLPELSMGMSDDFEVAVEEGATIVRIGRAIFGPRLEVPGPGVSPTLESNHWGPESATIGWS
jgi:pyridoxal phosphate enzyme (YggS family)